MSNQQPGGSDWRVTRQMAPPITAETVNCSVVSPTAQDCGASEFSVFFVPKEHKALLANHATMHRPSLKRHEASDGLRGGSSALAAATAADPKAAVITRSSTMPATRALPLSGTGGVNFAAGRNNDLSGCKPSLPTDLKPHNVVHHTPRSPYPRLGGRLGRGLLARTRFSLGEAPHRLRVQLVTRERVLLLLLRVVLTLVILLRSGGHRDGHRARRLGRLRPHEHARAAARERGGRGAALVHPAAAAAAAAAGRREVGAEQLVGPLLEHPQIDHDGLLVAAALALAHLLEQARVAAQLGTQALDGARHRVYRAARVLELLLRVARPLVHLGRPVLELLDEALPLRGLPLVLPLVLVALLPQLAQALLALFDLHVELVEVVEHLEVGVLVLDELPHELLDVGDARGRLDLGEGLLVGLHLLHAAVDGRLVLGQVPVALGHHLLELGLVVHRERPPRLRVVGALPLA
eukprot:scaffold103571_cov63-Phaeocystis_antarctica.AAC.1